MLGQLRIENTISWRKNSRLRINSIFLQFLKDGWTTLSPILKLKFLDIYNIFRLDRSTKAGGGACAFVNYSFKIERLNDLSSISPFGLHQLWLKVQVRDYKSFIICTVYRPPTTSLNCFDEDLSRTTISA